MIAYCSQHITKVTFSHTSITKLETGVFQKLFQKSILWIPFSLVIFKDLTRSYLILKNHYA